MFIYIFLSANILHIIFFYILKIVYLFKLAQAILSFACVTEPHYVSIIFARLWSVRKPLPCDTYNIGFPTAHTYKYKTKIKRGQRKTTLILKEIPCTHIPEKQRLNDWRISSVVLFCYADNTIIFLYNNELFIYFFQNRSNQGY